MSENGIAKPEDFKHALEHANVELVVLPSGLSVLLCRPPVFAALAMGRVGTQLQAKITDAKPEDIRPGDIAAFTEWLTETLGRLFVKPRFAAAPGVQEIGLADILLDDLKFIFRWLRGEVFSQDSGARIQELGKSEKPDPKSSILNPRSSTEDLGRFPGGQRTSSVPDGSGQTQQLSAESTAGTHRDAGLPIGLHRG
jgi:hypothetical protein